MNAKYKINGRPVGNLSVWCKNNGVKLDTVNVALYRSTNNKAVCMGYEIERLFKNKMGVEDEKR